MSGINKQVHLVIRIDMIANRFTRNWLSSLVACYRTADPERERASCRKALVCVALQVPLSCPFGTPRLQQEAMAPQDEAAM